jgi:3-oxoacyl-[acyl-carrier-protein] synthase II
VDQRARLAAAITGLGAVTPLGVGASALYERWAQGACAIEQGLGRCTEFDPRDHLSLKEARRLDRFSALALVAGSEAMAQAGCADALPCPPERFGCVIGTGIGGIETLCTGQDAIRERGERAVPPLSVPMMMVNAAAATLSLRFDLRGPSFAVCTACAAGAHAISCALSLLREGHADVVLAGGSEAACTPLARAAFAALEALSPSGRSLPFDARRDGFVLGEGAGAIVLEDPDRARARGAQILGYLRGAGSSSDAHHITAPRSDGASQARAIEAALADARADAGQISYINAHGTGTQLGDRAETLAIERALGSFALSIPVSSTKSAVGHTLGAAGAIEAVASVLALRARSAPPNVGLEQPDPELELDFIREQPRKLDRDRDQPLLALSSSFGFGGHNAVLCLEA